MRIHPLDRLLWALARSFPVAPDAPFLRGPRPLGPRIGADWPARYAEANGGRARRDPDGGLLDTLPHLGRVDPRIADFYARTARFALDVSVRWLPPFGVLSRVWAALYGRRWGQLELPPQAGPLTNEVWRLDGADPCTVWVRRTPGTERVLYVARYDLVDVPGAPDPCVRVLFPVPGGAWAVVLAVAVRGEALVLTEDGGRPGGPGLYLLPADGRPRYVRAFREEIAVHPADGRLDAVHRFWIAGIPFLTLGYAAPDPAASGPTASGPVASAGTAR